LSTNTHPTPQHSTFNVTPPSSSHNRKKNKVRKINRNTRVGNPYELDSVRKKKHRYTKHRKKNRWTQRLHQTPVDGAGAQLHLNTKKEEE
jgi:hypothetical protein